MSRTLFRLPVISPLSTILLLLLSAPAFSQEVVWEVGLRSFFDNLEFAGSQIQLSQTMAGVRLAPATGLELEGKHRIMVGADALHEWGSSKAIDGVEPIAYYEFDARPFRFLAGAFPRKVLEHYPRMFFADSILNYRPTLNGIFWEYALPEKGFANVWLDWTSRQSRSSHEAFFMGWSGRYNRGILSLQHFGYMFHLAPTSDPDAHVPVHDNGLMLTSVGVDLSGRTGLDRLETDLGWTLSLERNRGADSWYAPQGLLWETRIAYRRFELFNSFYKGGRMQKYYPERGNMLYHGDRLYSAGLYNRLDLGIHFIRSKAADVRLTYALHFAEGKVFHRQMLHATFNIGGVKE
ncbi:MAG: hypothetical protein LBD21_09735 [Tannerellaceae bacterium]|jgi:hypothetical protein|nr:hypothetical protein [Tannerellaceae bacterium]